jgi:hypothetical protein
MRRMILWIGNDLSFCLSVFGLFLYVLVYELLNMFFIYALRYQIYEYSVATF